jgi:Protein of unknown function (DUF1631)
MGIELKSARPMNVTSIDPLPEPLKKVRVQAAKLLASMLANMFDSADDALFELADKAINNADQTMYFDSMREVRIKREVMESLFARSLQDHFKIFQRNVGSKQAEQDSTALDDNPLSLIQDDELEESVAIRGMISKVNNLFGESLQQLTQRMEFLANQVTIDEENNPIGPVKLSESFQLACQELSLNIRAKLVVFKLFEKYVLGELGGLYSCSNELLIGAGVLPQMNSASVTRTKVRSQEQAERSDSSQSEGGNVNASASAEAAADQNEVFSLLRGLLANKAAQPQAGPSYLPVADSGPVLSQAELVDMLSTVQQQNNVIRDSLKPAPLNVRQALHSIVDGRGGLIPQAVGRVDDDSINLVSMLFEYILDDHSLPVPMKALLGRLQIPMLKVALLDKSFFSRGAHPARKLLNELASAALRWNEPVDVSHDTLFNKINDIVTNVLNEFESDVEIFKPLLEDFSQFVGKEKRRSDLIEQRTRDAEEGLGKTQRARADVGNLINDKAAGKALPTAVVELLREGWANYLFLLYVKQGTEDQAWHAAVQVVDDLIWSVDQDASFGHRSDLLKKIPSLLQSLREGLNAISFSKNRMRELFSELEGVHMACLKGPESEPESVDEAEEHIAGEALQGNEPIAAEQSVPVILETPVLESLDESACGEADDEYIAMVDSMAVGAWVEFLDDKGEKSRCKLAAIIRASGKYIFVNRVGIKVAEHTRSSLIEEAQAGEINMLDNALLFDRALESVIGHLREMKH